MTLLFGGVFKGVTLEFFADAMAGAEMKREMFSAVDTSECNRSISGIQMQNRDRTVTAENDSLVSRSINS